MKLLEFDLMFSSKMSIRNKELYEGFELGVIEWDLIEVLMRMSGDTKQKFVLKTVERRPEGVWLWLNENRFFLSCPSNYFPPKNARFTGLSVTFSAVTLVFRKGRKNYFLSGDALRVCPARKI